MLRIVTDMHTPPDSDTCKNCRHLVVNPTDAATIGMAANGFYNCDKLPATAFRTELAACNFTPSRFESKS